MRWVDVEPQVNSIQGWLLPGQARWLFETARALPDNAFILEIGGYLGHSTAALAFGCVGTSKRVFCIDTFSGNDSDFVGDVHYAGKDFLNEWIDNMARLGLRDYATPLIGKSRVYYDKWAAPISFLFIDGSHQYADALGDLCNFSKHVIPGGVVAMHDITPLGPWDGPYRAWCEMSDTLLEDTWVTCGTLGYGFRRNDVNADNDAKAA